MTTPARDLAPPAWHELALGTARVRSVIVAHGETVLGLDYPGGLRGTVAVPAVPRRESDPGVRGIRPLAVRITDRGWFECTLIGTSRTGPRRARISLPLALSLCASGIHTVLCTE